MNLCSEGHEEMCYESYTCPACDNIEELEGIISDLEDQIKDLERELKNEQQRDS